MIGVETLPNAGTTWSVGNTADFDHNGSPDILWRNYSTGENYLWYMDGASVTGGTGMSTVGNVNWHIEQ